MCSVGESEPRSWRNRLGAPRRAPQPASAGEDFASVSLNKGPPAVGVHWSLCVRPPGFCAAATHPRRPGPSGRVPERRCGPRAAPRGASPLPASSPRPARPPEASTEHPQVLSSLLVPWRGKLSPGGFRRPAARPSPARGQRRGKLLPEPTRLSGAAAYSRSRTRAPARAAQPRPAPLQPLLALPLPRKPPPPPSHQPTSTVHMAPHSQWAASPFRSPSRVPSLFPG